MRGIGATAAAVLAGVVLAACGGGPSKAAYIADADALCAKSDRKADKIGQRYFGTGQKPTPRLIQRSLEELLPLLRRTLADLRALERPDGDSDRLERLYDAVAEGIAVLERASTDTAAASRLFAQQRDPFEKADRLAREYGLKKCGEEG